MPVLSRITVSVESLDRARRLYEGALGIPLKYEMPGMAMLVTSDGVELQLHERPPTPGDAGVAISFGVDDVDALTVTAVGAGASIIKEPADQPWGERQSVLHDAYGHVTLLWARVNWICVCQISFFAVPAGRSRAHEASGASEGAVAKRRRLRRSLQIAPE